MNSTSLTLFHEYHSLQPKSALRNLDLSQLWQPTANDLKLGNRQLRHLLDWVEKYEEVPNREKMEVQCYLYPPLSFDIDLDGDWLRFERKPIGRNLRDFLSNNFRRNVF